MASREHPPRRPRRPLRRLALLTVLALAAHTGAAADDSTIATYRDLCMNQATTIPAPMGEADLKGHPSLKAYCGCFATAFEERALERRMHGGAEPTLEQAVREDRDMRAACRAKLNLPPLPARGVPK
jgi:hypothetical protein